MPYSHGSRYLGWKKYAGFADLYYQEKELRKKVVALVLPS
jgi:hypothetical protein